MQCVRSGAGGRHSGNGGNPTATGSLPPPTGVFLSSEAGRLLAGDPGHPSPGPGHGSSCPSLQAFEHCPPPPPPRVCPAGFLHGPSHAVLTSSAPAGRAQVCWDTEGTELFPVNRARFRCPRVTPRPTAGLQALPPLPCLPNAWDVLSPGVSTPLGQLAHLLPPLQPLGAPVPASAGQHAPDSSRVPCISLTGPGDCSPYSLDEESCP